MAKVADSKEKTLSAAVRLFSQRGYHGTGLQDILEAGGAPRGSLYFHFPKGKEQIGEAAVQLGTEGVREFITDAAQTSGNVQAFLVKLARGMAANLERSGYREGCPVATTALETAAQSDVLGRAARTAFQTWEQEIKRALISFGMKANKADRTATAVLSQLEGALLLARTYRSLEPMQRAEKALLVLAGCEALK
ncbi:MAG: TetR/AcrR family transcriptional regulator [Xanthobacteraceae bacterium]|jgi:TetR/AcrR family transcriptional repressor of lmrAB and yxaGH operons